MKKKTAVATSVIFLVLLFGLAIITWRCRKKRSPKTKTAPCSRFRH